LKVWYDACTGKHVRYGVAIAKKLRSLGHKIILTTRNHPDTIALAGFLKEKFVVVGKYNPKSLSNRLEESLKRQLHFCEMFKNTSPSYAVSHGSIDLCRVAFGLDVPTISTADSPHAIAANKLALPLVKYLVISKAFPKGLYRKYGASNIVQFEGVDEAAWIKSYEPAKPQYEKPLIVVRQAETKAAYSIGKKDVTLEIAQNLTDVGNVLFISRYERRSRKGLTIPHGFIDTASLAGYADLVVGVGGTIAREAALQGTPSLVIPLFGRFHTNEYLAKKGFPLYTCSPKKTLAYAKEYLGDKKDVKEKLEELENPVDTIEKLMLEKGE